MHIVPLKKHVTCVGIHVQAKPILSVDIPRTPTSVCCHRGYLINAATLVRQIGDKKAPMPNSLLLHLTAVLDPRVAVQNVIAYCTRNCRETQAKFRFSCTRAVVVLARGQPGPIMFMGFMTGRVVASVQARMRSRKTNHGAGYIQQFRAMGGELSKTVKIVDDERNLSYSGPRNVFTPARSARDNTFWRNDGAYQAIRSRVIKTMANVITATIQRSLLLHGRYNSCRRGWVC